MFIVGAAVDVTAAAPAAVAVAVAAIVACDHLNNPCFY